MDFIIGFPVVKGLSVILVVIDRLSKYGHFIPLPANYSGITVAEAFVTHIIKLHGIPRTIVSDRDKSFTSAFWRHLMKLQGTHLCFGTAYHPQTDGQSEALNKCLEMYLRCFVHDYPRQWLKFLPWAEFWYNSAYHTTTGFTPFKIVYGRDPPPLLRHSSLEDTPYDVHQQLVERDAVLQILRSHIERAQRRMKHYADKKRSDETFKVDDMVLVRLHPYRQHSVHLRKFQKLALQYFGPFRVTDSIGKVAYRLALP